MKNLFLLVFGNLSILIVAADLNIATTSGITNGYIKNNVVIWEDIPFAQPPVGDLRWRAPRKLLQSKSIIKSKENNFCIQRTSTFGGS